MKEDFPKLSTKRICGCEGARLSCLNASEWFARQNPVWEFTRCEEDTAARGLGVDAFPLALAERVIELYTHRGELVLDPFCGSGTSLLAAQRLRRSAVGFDISAECAEFARRRIARLDLFSASAGVSQEVVCADALSAADYFDDGSIKLLFSAPFSLSGSARAPSGDRRDIDELSPREGAARLSVLMRKLSAKLTNDAHIVLVISDVWRHNRLLPRHIDVIEELSRVGFELRNIIIWDKRAIYSKLGIYGYPNNFIAINGTYEYILDFRSNKEKTNEDRIIAP